MNQCQHIKHVACTTKEQLPTVFHAEIELLHRCADSAEISYQQILLRSDQAGGYWWWVVTTMSLKGRWAGFVFLFIRPLRPAHPHDFHYGTMRECPQCRPALWPGLNKRENQKHVKIQHEHFRYSTFWNLTYPVLSSFRLLRFWGG